MSRVSLELTPGGRKGNYTWGRKDEEYMADFVLVTRRTLTPAEYRLFSYHFLLGADYNLCCRRLRIDRGTFFHAVYRIEQKLGQVFRDLQPYGLYPVDEYYNGPRKECAPAPNPPAVRSRPPRTAGTVRLRVPLRRSA